VTTQLKLVVVVVVTTTNNGWEFGLRILQLNMTCLLYRIKILSSTLL